MNRRVSIIGITLVLVAVGLSGCVSESPISKGNVKFTIEDVTITSELEIHDSWTNETKTVESNNSKFVIISVIIENKEDEILEVQESFLDGLTDDEDNNYYHKMYVEINDSTYSVADITPINESELFESIIGISTDVPPNSTVLKKIVYEIPLDREPKKLRLGYGFKANELTSVERWFSTEMNI